MISQYKFEIKKKNIIHECYRSNEPFLSVFMWGVNHTVKELKHVSVPGKICPHSYHFRTFRDPGFFFDWRDPISDPKVRVFLSANQFSAGNLSELCLIQALVS